MKTLICALSLLALSSASAQTIDAARYHWLVLIRCAPEHPELGADSVEFRFSTPSTSVVLVRTDGQGMGYELTGESLTQVFHRDGSVDSTRVAADTGRRLPIRVQFGGLIRIGRFGDSASVDLEKFDRTAGVNGADLYAARGDHYCAWFLPHSTAVRQLGALRVAALFAGGH